jgi:DNA-binding CsgD family transcriptional regulator
VLRDEKRATIAQALSVSIWTVDFHLLNIRTKLRVQSTQAVAIFFARHPPTDRS